MKIIECPRDAMQGFVHFIETPVKIKYLNLLLQAGFDTLDFGSFVSPKAIPQLRDTEEVLASLDLSATKTKLLAIVANVKGAEMAVKHKEIRYLGFPFSISETFQQRNTNSSIADSLVTVARIQELCKQHGKELVIYISMGFGNPYGDEWNAEIASHWTSKMVDMEVKIISLSDTIGIANKESIAYMFSNMIQAFPQVEFGAHLHTQPHNWQEKIDAAYKNGCRRYDGAIKGFGGCPMAADELTGNMPTENIIAYMEQAGEHLPLNKAVFNEAMAVSSQVFV
ncbi:MAG: hydroxymethylglutaryl-CoA lyase [Bacteroidia bacterium]